MHAVLVLSSLLLAALRVAAQGPLIPEPGKIVSPKNGAEYLYGVTVPFAYNYTEAAEHLLAPPVVNVYVHKANEEHYIEVAKDLSCTNSPCPDGILKHNITLRDFTPLVGTGTYEMITVQENFSPFLINASRIVTRSITGYISFSIVFPLGGPPIADSSLEEFLVLQQ